MVDISGSYGKLKRWVNRKIAAIVLSSLADVDDTNIGNDKILQYKSASEKHEYVDPPSGYTDAEAVAAVLAGDDYVKNTGDEMTGPLKIDYTWAQSPTYSLHIKKNVGHLRLSHPSVSESQASFLISNATGVAGYFVPLFVSKGKAAASAGYRGGFLFDTDSLPDGKAIASFMGRLSYGVVPSGNKILFDFCNYYYASPGTRILSVKSNNRIDFHNHYIANPKNHVSATLSGTKKIVEIDIGGTPYYFEVYPTKT